MATALATSIEQLKQEFCRSHAHLPEQQIRQLWFQAMSELPSSGSNDNHPSLAEQTPRSMSYSSTNMTQLPSSFGSMDRVRSAPATSTMTRSPSTSSASNNLQRCNSYVSNWQSSCDEQSNAYAVYSESASMRSQPSLQPIAETSALTNNSMVEYTPDEYITSCIEPPASSSLPLSQTQNPRQLHVQLTPNAQWSPSLDDSTSPSTPSTALMTPVTQSSNSMSRQSSYNPQFHDEVSMLRIQSDSSSLFSILSEDGTISFPLDVESKNISNSVDTSHFLSQFTGNPSENFLSHVPVFSASVSALASSENEPCLVEDMRRSASSSSESDASSASAASISSRQQRREREINAQAGRCKIAPKAIPCNSETKPASSNVQMTRIRSEDGSSKNVGVISRAPYVRPQHPKIMCPHCSERPEGFRGTHELDRHVARAHTKVRKGFICIDASNDKRFLANCKHCRNKKVYGAYYNAAAHLRRAHFHPRKRGRKGKHDEKRGGIGGGDDPPMDYLKQNWIKEIEIENKLAASSPDSGSDSAEPDVNNSFDATYDVEMTYQPVASTTSDVPMSIPIDPNQYIDYSMCMNESDTLYNHQMMYTTNEAIATTSDINDFQFDAYRTQ